MNKEKKYILPRIQMNEGNFFFYDSFYVFIEQIFIFLHLKNEAYTKKNEELARDKD
jgi:hypothetical protein